MTVRRIGTAGSAWIVMAMLLVLAAGEIRAQAPGVGDVYRIGVGDVLRIAVPREPGLEREETVQTDGTIYLSQVGKIALAGLTVAEAEEMLLRRLRLIEPDIIEVVLSVIEYNALRIFVLGAVNSPGSYTFQTPPTLWEVLRAAGGPAAEASLASCRVISNPGGGPVSRTVNLSGYLTGVDFPEDVLQGGDTLVIPRVADGVVGVPSALGVQVFGGVNTPTTVPIDEPTDLISVLMLAGATLADAQINKVDWVHRGSAMPGEAVATRVDMRLFLEQGLASGNPIVHPGDVIYVTPGQPNWIQRNLPLILTTLTSIATLLVAYDRLAD